MIEYASGGDIFDLLNRLGSFSEEYARFVVSQTILALEYLHEQGYIHLDVKPEAVIVIVPSNSVESINYF